MNHTLSVDQQCYMVVLCQGQLANGDDYWAYVQLKPSKAKAFKKAQRKGAFRIEDYGDVIEWGKGLHVPLDVKERMEAGGANHSFEEEARNILMHQQRPAAKRDPESFKSSKVIEEE